MKKTLAALLVLWLALVPVSVFAANPLTLSLSAKEVNRGGELTLSGTVSGETGDGIVTVKIVSPAQTVLYVDAIPAVSGSYSVTLGIPRSEDLAPLGRYSVVVGSGSDTKTDTFSVVTGGGTPGGGSSGPPTPVQTPAPSSPATDASGIPVGAGQVSGTTVRPELAADGRYLVGRDTLTKAAQQAGNSGAVTIELPAEAGETGAALEMPGQALKQLEKEKIGLIITNGNRTVKFPAGAFALSGEASSRVRIVVNAAWSAEAKTTVEQSVRADAAYKPTDVVLSVVVQVIVGNQVKEIHQLDRPATVSIELTAEQEKQISSELAGVYYVNGDGAEYVPGKLEGRIFTFTATHFSYYAILEYNKTFMDLTGHWAEPAVKALAAKHLVTGVDARHYAPNRSITRAEFVTLIMRTVAEVQDARGESRPAPGGAAESPFKDVAPDRYYAEAVAQAVQLGIVSGYNGAFRPNDSITREEAVVTLVRAAETMKVEAAADVQKLPAFTDAEAISAWAMQAVNLAWSQGWIQGDGSRFNPSQALTRAEVAVMIRRLL